MGTHGLRVRKVPGFGLHRILSLNLRHGLAPAAEYSKELTLKEERIHSQIAPGGHLPASAVNALLQ